MAMIQSVRNKGRCGFFVSADGYVVTNDHVRRLYVIFEGEPLEAFVVDRDSDLDILLKIQASADALPVDLITPRKGEEVAVIGYPSVQLLGNEVKAGAHQLIERPREHAYFSAV